MEVVGVPVNGWNAKNKWKKREREKEREQCMEPWVKPEAFRQSVPIPLYNETLWLTSTQTNTLKTSTWKLCFCSFKKHLLLSSICVPFWKVLLVNKRWHGANISSIYGPLTIKNPKDRRWLKRFSFIVFLFCFVF